MNCEHCGNKLKPEPKKDPWCMYQVSNGKVISKLFDPDEIPKGWFDSPKAAKAPVKKKPKPETVNDDSPADN